MILNETFDDCSPADAIAKYITAGGSLQGFDFDHRTWQKHPCAHAV